MDPIVPIIITESLHDSRPSKPHPPSDFAQDFVLFIGMACAIFAIGMLLGRAYSWTRRK